MVRQRKGEEEGKKVSSQDESHAPSTMHGQTDGQINLRTFWWGWHLHLSPFIFFLFLSLASAGREEKRFLWSNSVRKWNQEIQSLIHPVTLSLSLLFSLSLPLLCQKWPPKLKLWIMQTIHHYEMPALLSMTVSTLSSSSSSSSSLSPLLSQVSPFFTHRARDCLTTLFHSTLLYSLSWLTRQKWITVNYDPSWLFHASIFLSPCVFACVSLVECN